MKKHFLCLLSSLLVLFYLSCSTTRNATPFRVGLLPLEHYAPVANNLSADTVFSVYQTEKDFSSAFSPSIADARRPGFAGQLVVAIALRNAASTPLQFEKAEVVGTAINVYAVSCTSGNCPTGSAFLATTPKVGNAKTVRFFINGAQRSEVSL